MVTVTGVGYPQCGGVWEVKVATMFLEQTWPVQETMSTLKIIVATSFAQQPFYNASGQRTHMLGPIVTILNLRVHPALWVGHLLLRLTILTFCLIGSSHVTPASLLGSFNHVESWCEHQPSSISQTCCPSWTWVGELHGASSRYIHMSSPACGPLFPSGQTKSDVQVCRQLHCSLFYGQ